MEFIKRIFCNHNFKVIEDTTWIVNWATEMSHREKRKFLVCMKCGYKRKISKR